MGSFDDGADAGAGGGPLKVDSGVSVLLCGRLGVVGGGMIGVVDGGALAGKDCVGVGGVTVTDLVVTVAVAGAAVKDCVGVGGVTVADLVVTVAVAGAAVTVAGAGGIVSGAVAAGAAGATTGAATMSSMLSMAGTGRGLISAETWKRSVFGCMRIVCVNCLEF